MPRWIGTLALNFVEFSDDIASSATNLVLGAVLLGLDAWGLTANGKELRARKRDRARAHSGAGRIRPVPGGFAF